MRIMQSFYQDMLMPKHLGIYSENSDCIASATDVHFWNQRYADKEYFYGEAPSTFRQHAPVASFKNIFLKISD